MIFEETFEVAAGRDAVAGLFADVAKVGRCVPGLEEIRHVGDHRYLATLGLRVGPIATRFSGDLEMDDSQAPDRFSARGRGADARTGSQVEVSFAGDLRPLGSQRTEVRAHVDVTIRGRLGQFGTGIIEATGHQLLGEFAGCLNATLSGVAAPAPAVSLWRVLVRGVSAWLRRWLRDLRGRRAAQTTPRAAPRTEAPVSVTRGPSYVEPNTVAEACDLLAERPDSAKAIAGGTAVVLMMQQGLIRPQLLVSLRSIASLRALERSDGMVRIGGGTTLAEIASSPLVRRELPALAYACQRVGNVRIRNVATLGGNLAEADYASDPPAMLAALGATCTVQGVGATRTVAVADLITGFYETVLEPGDLITEVGVPASAGDRRSAYVKYISRSSEDRPCVGVAVCGDFSGETVDALTVVVGAAAPVLQRLPDVTAQVAGGPLDGDAIAHVSQGYAQGIEPMSDARGSAWYRRRMIEVFVRRALGELATEARGSE